MVWERRRGPSGRIETDEFIERIWLITVSYYEVRQQLTRHEVHNQPIIALARNLGVNGRR